LGLADRVRFLGQCSDVGLVYDACDVFVLSSLCEACPYALLEAMAHELPVVATRVGGVPEIVVDGETGFLAAPRDAESLAGALAKLIDSPELRRRQGQAARERVVKHFHEADMVRRTIQLYRELLRDVIPNGKTTH
jgi:glycosyltransferase involved in cell wall biosynthesis